MNPAPEPVNFELLDDERKKSLIANYRGFLNQLTSPIQILIRTVDADLTKYFEAQETKFAESSKEFSELYTDFRKFEDAFLVENTVRERHYYLIARHIRKKHIGTKVAEKLLKLEETELKQLDQQLQIIMEKLANCALDAKRLENEELTNLLLSYSDCESDEERQKKADGKPAPLFAFLGKKRPEKPDLFRFLITPSFEIHPGFAKVNEAYHRIVKVTGYPRNVEDGWLLSFLGKNEGYDISLHIHPSTITQTLVLLHNQIIHQTADLMMSTAKGTPNPALEIKRTDTLKTYEQLYKGEEKLFRVSLYLDNKEIDMEALDLLTEKCSANLNALLMIPKVVKYRMAEGIKSALPLGQDKLESQREFLTSPLSATFPFISPASTKRKGIMFAHEEETLNPLFVDFDGMSNKHFFVLGISGSGKSYSAKYMVMQALFSENPRIYILDPNAEYVDLCNSLGGENIEISRESENCINVFELNGQSLGDKFLNLLTVFDIITGGLSEAQKGVLNEVLPRAYASRGIHSDDPGTWSKPPPIFTDVHRELNGLYEYYSKRGRRSAQDLKRSIEVLINRVGMYTESGFFGFLDKQTKINLDNRFLNFDLSNLPSAVKPLVMFAVMDFVSKEIRKDRQPKVLLIDEGWALLRSKEAENYLFEFVKTSRKYGASIGFITQEIEDLLGSDTGRSILNMTSTKILMRQNSNNMEIIRKSMRLNDNEGDFLLRCRKGHGLLITEKEHFKFFTKASDRIHAMITTDPREVKDTGKKKRLEEMQAQKEEMQEVVNDKTKMIGQISEAGKKSEVFEPKDSWYPAKGLGEGQKKTLLGLGFVAINTTKHGQGGNTKYFVKPKKNESPLHHFVCKVVEEDLKGHAEDIVLNFSTEPDVVVKVNGKALAFEVETGTATVRGDKRIEEKFDRVRKNYANFFIVVSDWKMKNKYKKYGRVITRQEMVPAIKRAIEQLKRA